MRKLLLVVTVLSIATAIYAINEGWIGYMPPIEDLQNPINRYATQIYSADGRIIGTWNYNRENRILVDYTKLSPSLVQALVATEDVRFYDHSGRRVPEVVRLSRSSWRSSCIQKGPILRWSVSYRSLLSG